MPNATATETLHLMTQRNQPYGSERRCCERCGVMIWTTPRPRFTNNLDVWRVPPEGFVRCVDLPEEVPMPTNLVLPRVADVPSLTEADVRSITLKFKAMSNDRAGLQGKQLAERWLTVVRTFQDHHVSDGQFEFWILMGKRLEIYLKEEA